MVSPEEIEKVARIKAWQRILNHVEMKYHDLSTIQAYEKERSNYRVTKAQKSFGRTIWSSPDMLVDFFLEQYFKPMYGPKWRFNVNVLRHELVKPWMLVPSKEVG